MTSHLSRSAPLPNRLSLLPSVLVGALFVLSGACGLAYEVVWTRYLGLFLGNTVLLHTAVLGSFMGGMALGSLLAGRFADRLPRPLRAYGWLELGVAVYGAAFPLLAALGQGMVAAATGPFPPGTIALLVFRLALAAALLLLPTLLMGMTFPLLTAHLDRSAGAGAGGANWLYFANCAGAVLGTLLTGLALIPSFGMRATVLGVAALNALIALAAMALGHAALPEAMAAEDGSKEQGGNPAAGGERWVLAVICLSGGTAFLYELVWTRFFAVSLGSSTYSFTLMLAAFISGLALGSVAAQLLPTRRAPLAWLALTEILIGIAVAASLPLYPRLPYWSWWLKWLLRPSEESIWLFHGVQYGLTFVVMAVPTFLFGLTFPTAIRAFSAEGRSASAGASAVYGWNTLGTLGGVLLAGCVLIPALGLRHTLQIGAGANLTIGALLFFARVPTDYFGGRVRPAMAGITLLGALLVLFNPQWPPAPLGFASHGANFRPPANWEQYAGMRGSRQMVFYREDFGSTVAVIGFQEPHTGKPATSLIVDGKADASSYGDLPTQTLIGSLPLVLKPEARDVFLLGLGSGMTAGSVLAHPVDRVDCAEISRTVPLAAAHFGDVNRQALRDPRLHLTLDDGRTFLAARTAQGRKYDVIISEPTNPWIAGVGNLFSDEAFQATARGLKPGGIVAQWFHSYALNDPLIATILKTFRRTFPYVMIFQGVATDYILIGSREPFQPNFRAMAERLKRPAVRDDLARSNITGLVSLLHKQVFAPSGEIGLEEGGRINTDDRPILEFAAPHALYLGQSGVKVVQDDQRYTPGSGLLIEQYLGGREPTQAEFRELLRLESDRRSVNPFLERRLLRHYLRRWPDDAGMLLRSARRLKADGRNPEAHAQALRSAQLGNREAQPFADRLRVEMAWDDRAAVVPSSANPLPTGR